MAILSRRPEDLHIATREEVTEVLGAAIAVNAGAALVYSACVLDAFSAKQS